MIYSGGIKSVKTELNMGLFTYRIQPIYLKDRNADEVFEKIRQKQEDGTELTEEDYASLSLTPLMSGNMKIKEKIKEAAAGVSTGLRINPECSTQEGHEIYDPCGTGSRLGITRAELDKAIQNGFDLSQIDGFHFHTLCEQNSDALETTLDAVEKKFGDLLYGRKWLNMGGGHHITKAGYDMEKLENCIRRMQETYDLEIYLEPGEAVALNAGYLETTVLDIVENNGIKILVLDTSAACHMPDVLEMPYRPPLKDSGKAGEKAYTYRLSSCTCLAGDVIGDYSFDKEIKVGNRLTFCDMAIYSMVKNNTFNGMPLPDIAVMGADKECRVIRRFGYEDFKGRLS